MRFEPSLEGVIQIRCSELAISYLERKDPLTSKRHF